MTPQELLKIFDNKRRTEQQNARAFAAEFHHVALPTNRPLRRRHIRLMRAARNCIICLRVREIAGHYLHALIAGERKLNRQMGGTGNNDGLRNVARRARDV